MGSARPKNPDGVRAVAAVCDRRWEANPTQNEPVFCSGGL